MNGVEVITATVWFICGLLNVLYCMYVNYNLMDDDKLSSRHFFTAFMLGPILTGLGCAVVGILMIVGVSEVISEVSNRWRR